MTVRTRDSAAMKLYRRAMGVGESRLLPVGEEGGAAGASLRDVAYYTYRKGFWPLLRGTCHRVRLRAAGPRFFLGRGARLLFPGHLSVGRNVAIGDHVYMSCYGRDGVRLGDNVRIREFGWVQVSSHLSDPGCGLDVGDDTYIGPHSVLGAAGGIVVGRGVTLGAYVQLLAENHRFDDGTRPVGEQGVIRKGITVADGAWLGNSVIVLDGVSIGANAVVGAGSVVTRDVPAGAVVAGNPARVLRQR
jgi:acetyltransferase-like isoleucine patch superfamily enzyme